MEPDPTPRPEPSADPPASDPGPPREPVGLLRLRERVEGAAREIERLREANAELSERIEALQGQAGGGAPLLVGDDPEALRDTIQGFIDTIDRLLAEPPADSGQTGASSA